MEKYNFLPGPSQLHKNFSLWVQKALDAHFLSQYHRTKLFADVYQSIYELFQTRLKLPKNYELYFVPSASEAWNLTANSLIFTKALFYFNGNFGKKWFEYVRESMSFATPIPFEVNTLPEIQKNSEAFIGIVHTETSNGSQLPNEFLKNLRESNPNSCIVVDATASMGGVYLPWEMADVWFASVQKCFGLPPGMAVMVVNPSAIQRAIKKNWNYYNGIINLSKNFKKWQTPNTPNLLNIWCLNECLKEMPEITIVEKVLSSRKNVFFQTHPNLRLVEEKYTATTVWAFYENNPEAIIQKAQQQEIIIGAGYGNWKNNTFRIANFPAIKNEGWLKLHSFFKNL
ncbi:MAG: class V aminotransferase [Bacteroidia bacterium]|nr:MAG: class V aminotransferase [Bacteroidia bacterium]